MATDMSVATTILQQLGGRRFAMMTGAKNFIGSDRALSFRLPRAARGINGIRIELTPADTYTVEAVRVRGTERRVIDCREDVYCDALEGVVGRLTGLATRL